jgi:hypothetical protein
MSAQELTSLRLRGRANVRAVEALLDRMLATAWLSYALIAALQMKILWDIWRFRDLTTGDTTSYFAGGYRWYEDFAVNIVWSPLYTAFYGTVYLLTHDIYTATIFHRVIIVMAATLGVLALMRQLLPPAIALLIAAWWAVLPINFETLYEVHLFALLPILAAWLVTTIDDTPWTRGIALAILIATAVLVRNEQIVAVFIFAVICAVREYCGFRHAGKIGVASPTSRLAGYGLPLLAALLFSAFFYWRSYVKFPAIMQVADAKHVVNMCQVYAFGYSQRHPDWTLSPWLECRSLMQTVFGREHPSLGQMIWSNPSATIEHFLWNASLTFNGFQAALFDRMSGVVNPDYAPVIRNVAVASVLSAIVLAIVVAGSIKVAREWNYWWPVWLRPRRDTFFIMFAVLLVSGPVIMTQRPRPSYLFPTTVIIMLVVGLAIYVLLGPKRLIVAKMLAAVVVPGLLVFVPPYFVTYKSDRPLYTNLQRLQPYGSFLENPKNKILLGDYNGELRGYLHFAAPAPVTFDYSIFSAWHAPQTLDQFLASRDINIIFVQPRVMPELKARPEAQQFLTNPESVGWKKLAPLDGETNWLLLYREAKLQ